MSNIHGTCEPSFEGVKQAFAANFENGGERGASLCVYKDGRKVVDVWGGLKDPETGEAWQENTLSLVFSITKAATALCAHMLIDQGKLDLDAKVTDYWPEFGAAGKQDVTVRMMLAHQSGVAALRGPIRDGGLCDFDYMVDRVAAEEPFWEPGTDNGYHMITFGWTVGELIRRVSGRSLGAFFREEIAGPLGLDFHIGLPDADFDRTAKMIPYQPGADFVPTPFAMKLLSDPTSLQFLSLMNVGDFTADAPASWKAEIGGGGGIANARAVAQMFSALIGPNAFLSQDRIDDMRRPAAETDCDQTLLIPSRFGQGFMLRMDNQDLPGEGNSLVIPDTAFGHVGMGGSLGFADPESGVAFGYTMTKMGGGILLNSRGQRLVDAVYEAL